jgi:hypothetical protein
MGRFRVTILFHHQAQVKGIEQSGRPPQPKNIIAQNHEIRGNRV